MVTDPKAPLPRELKGQSVLLAGSISHPGKEHSLVLIGSELIRLPNSALRKAAEQAAPFHNYDRGINTATLLGDDDDGR